MKPGVQSTHPANSGNRRPSAIPLPHGSKPHDNYQRIQDFIKKLEKIYDDIENVIFLVLDSSEYSKLSIKCEELKLNRDGFYASPRPQPYFFNASFPPVDLEKKGVIIASIMMSLIKCFENI